MIESPIEGFGNGATWEGSSDDKRADVAITVKISGMERSVTVSVPAGSAYDIAEEIAKAWNTHGDTGDTFALHVQGPGPDNETVLFYRRSIMGIVEQLSVTGWPKVPAPTHGKKWGNRVKDPSSNLTVRNCKPELLLH